METNKTHKRKKQKKGIITRMHKLTLENLLSLMQEKIDSFQYEEAQKYCQEALRREPDNVSVLEASGSLCLELGNEEGAKRCYGRAITVEPEEGHSKYFTMAQLLSENDSLQCYFKGIEILSKKIESLLPKIEKNKFENNDVIMNGTDSSNSEANGSLSETSDASVESKEEESPSLSSLKRELSLSFCSVAELYMTDLCDEECAEKESENNIKKAIEVDSSNPEAYQHMASFLLVKQNTDEAEEYIKKSLSLWLPAYEAVDEGNAEAGSFDPVEVCPLSYDTRLSTSRILIEVHENDSAATVLEGLLSEDDEVVDTWYLLGWSCFLQEEDHKGEAKYYFKKALQVNAIYPCSDAQLLGHINELLDELKDVEEDVMGEEEEVDISSSSEEEGEEEVNGEAMDVS